MREIVEVDAKWREWKREWDAEQERKLQAVWRKRDEEARERNLEEFRMCGAGGKEGRGIGMGRLELVVGRQREIKKMREERARC